MHFEKVHTHIKRATGQVGGGLAMSLLQMPIRDVDLEMSEDIRYTQQL